MGTRRLEFALPDLSQCEQCVDALEQQLAQFPGLSAVTIDRIHQRLQIDIEEADFVEKHLGALIAQLVTGPRQGPGLHQQHAPTRTAATIHSAAPHDHGAEMRTMAQSNRRRLLWVAAAGFAIMVAEILGGLYANSLVLLADATHYSTDIAAVLLAFLAITWSLKGATKAKTFGYHRAEVVAAFVNALVLWAVSLYFVVEALRRLRDPPEVSGPVVLAIGGVSLVTNLALAALLRKGGSENINIRAAYLHILSDVLGSAAALGAGLAIQFGGWHIADPLLTLLITGLIVAFTWRLTRQSLHILLEGAPAKADPEDIERSLRGIPAVQDVHDLHVWTLTSGVDSLSAHVVLDAAPQSDAVSHEIHRRLRDAYGIEHVTVQLEDPSCPCDTIRHAWLRRATAGG